MIAITDRKKQKLHGVSQAESLFKLCPSLTRSFPDTIYCTIYYDERTKEKGNIGGEKTEPEGH